MHSPIHHPSLPTFANPCQNPLLIAPDQETWERDIAPVVAWILGDLDHPAPEPVPPRHTVPKPYRGADDGAR